jgi:hypothetical protein
MLNILKQNSSGGDGYDEGVFGTFSACYNQNRRAKMSFLSDYFSKPFPGHSTGEVDKLMNELYQIGIEQDYLSERPGGAYNHQCRHLRTREIGKRFNEIGGLPLMQWAHRKVKKKVGKLRAEHLEYAWDGVGPWQA